MARKKTADRKTTAGKKRKMKDLSPKPTAARMVTGGRRRYISIP